MTVHRLLKHPAPVDSNLTARRFNDRECLFATRAGAGGSFWKGRAGAGCSAPASTARAPGRAAMSWPSPGPSRRNDGAASHARLHERGVRHGQYRSIVTLWMGQPEPSFHQIKQLLPS